MAAVNSDASRIGNSGGGRLMRTDCWREGGGGEVEGSAVDCRLLIAFVRAPRALLCAPRVPSRVHLSPCVIVFYGLTFLGEVAVLFVGCWRIGRW